MPTHPQTFYCQHRNQNFFCITDPSAAERICGYCLFQLLTLPQQLQITILKSQPDTSIRKNHGFCLTSCRGTAYYAWGYSLPAYSAFLEADYVASCVW